jgi:hypothetical protein
MPVPITGEAIRPKKKYQLSDQDQAKDFDTGRLF